MEHLYDRFGCEMLGCYAVKLGNGCEDGYDPECSEFIRGISDVFTVLYELMFVEPRCSTRWSSSYCQMERIDDFADKGVYGCFTYPSGCISEPRFFQFLQQLKYVIDGYAEEHAEDDFSSHCEDLYNFIFETFGNMESSNYIDLSRFTELSSFRGSNIRDYRGKKIDENHPFPQKLDLFFLKQVPSHINYQWYKAAWSMLMNALNTPAINLNGSGWTWISPMLQYNGSWFKDFSEFNDNSWLSSKDSLKKFDEQLAASTTLYSMTGTNASKYVMYDDMYGTDRTEGFNAPINVPVEEIRDYIGLETSHGSFCYDHGGCIGGVTDYEFKPYGCACKRELSIGTDWKHWSKEGREEATEAELSAYPRYSPLRKCYRDATGNLRNVGGFSNDSDEYRQLPPIRLVKENVFSLLYFWNAFLAGDHNMSYGYKPQYAHAYADLQWKREHYFKHYLGKVEGQCKLYEEAGQWYLSGGQSGSEYSESGFDWAPASEFHSEEAVVERFTGINRIGYANNCSFVQGGEDPQLGNTIIHEQFGALSGGLSSGNVISIDTMFYPDKGMSQEQIQAAESEWSEYMRQLVSIFPETADSKKRRAKQELDEEYLSGYIPACEEEISSWEESLSSLEGQLSTLSGDSWLVGWEEAVNQTYGCEYGERHPDRIGNFGSFYPSDWDGEDPAPFEYFKSWSDRTNATTIYTNGMEMHDMDEGYGCAGSRIMSEVWQAWDSYKAEKTQEEQQQMEALIENISRNCYSDSVVGYINQTLATDIQQAFTAYGPVIEGKVDESVWKDVIRNINGELYGAALEIADVSQETLMAAKPDEYDEDEFNALLNRVDNDFRLRVESERQAYYEDQSQALTQAINEIRGEIQRMRDRIEELWEEYYRRLEEIEAIEDDEMPLPEELDRLYRYYADARPPSTVKFSFTSQLAMYALMPDDIGRKFDTRKNLWREMYYDCISPTHRYPVGGYKDAQYMLPFRRYSYNKELSSYENDYKVRVFDKYGHNAFDEFRNYMMMDLDYEAEAVLGGAADRKNFFGTPPNNIRQYDIGRFKLSVDIGAGNHGIYYVGSTGDNLSVQIDGQLREAYELMFFSQSGTSFFTKGFQIQSILECHTGVDWQIDTNSEDWDKYSSYYGNFPEWSPPEIPGNVLLETGQCLLARVDYEDMLTNM